MAGPMVAPPWLAMVQAHADAAETRLAGRRRDTTTTRTREDEESRELLRAIRGTGPRHAKDET